MRITLQDFRQEFVQKGRNGYTKGTAVYTYNGQQREQNILSFANPAIFGILKDAAPGTAFDVDITKNDKGYNEWAKLVPASEEANAPAPAKTGVATRTTYETPEERAKRQILIVRQSSISSAIAMLSPGSKSALDTGSVLKTAQELSDWVFENSYDTEASEA